VVGYFKRPCASKAVPVSLHERLVSTDAEIVVHRHCQQRCRIRGGVFVGQALPVNEVRRLRPFVHDLPFRALTLEEKLNLLSCRLEVAGTIQCEGGPQSVTAKVPTETGPYRGSGAEES